MKRASSRKTKAPYPVTENGQSSGLRIVAAKEKRLSKNQKTFNQLLEKVAQLNGQTETESRRLDTILQHYSKTIPKLENRYAESQLGIARALDKTTAELNFGASQIASFGQLIRWFCTQAFAKKEPGEEAKILYAKWSENSFDEEKQAEELLRKQQIAAELKTLYNILIDPSEIDTTPEGFARLRELIREQLRQREHEETKEPEQPKTKKQLAREQKQKALDSEKLKSLRAIYLSLAKMLHPDTATGAAEKLRKEELMKKITGAYQAKDLPELLKLELEFVASESNHLQSLADQKLSGYIASLREQATALEHQLYLHRSHPRFAKITSLAGYTEREALNKIKLQEKALKEQIQEAAKVTSFLHNSSNKKTIFGFVQMMENEINRASE